MTRRALFVALCWLAMALKGALAETTSVIDPTEGLEPQSPPAAAANKAAPTDAAVQRARSRAEEEKRRRARAEARAQAAESEAAKLRAQDQARRVEEAARKAAQSKAAAARAAAANAASARQAKYAAERAALLRETAERETAAREAAARELAVREAAAKEAAAKEAAAKEAAAREAAAREAAAREASARLAMAQAATRKEVRANGSARAGTVFQDCRDCPEMVWLPQGEFYMGDAAAGGRARQVSVSYSLAVGRFEVTFAEWDACVAANGCRRRAQDSGWGRGWQPVINVSWSDAQQYVTWLTRRTGRHYRLLNEAEWEYAARAGSEASYWWGNQTGRGDANCADCGSKWDGRQAAPVGRFAPNPFGLYDMHGNVSEWVEDAVSTDNRIVRGGAWRDSAKAVRSTWRTSVAYDYFDNRIGFRVARTD